MLPDGLHITTATAQRLEAGFRVLTLAHYKGVHLARHGQPATLCGRELIGAMDPPDVSVKRIGGVCRTCQRIIGEVAEQLDANAAEREAVIEALAASAIAAGALTITPDLATAIRHG